MPTLFAHSIAGYAIARSNFKASTGLFLLCILTAILPDIDILAFKYGIPYESMWGHRGISHSFFFAGIWAVLCSFLFKKRLIAFICLFLAYCSHGALDAITSGGLGVAFFAPFDNTRYFFPWRPIRVSPIGLEGFIKKAALVLKSEFIWVGLPTIAYLLILSVLKRWWWRRG